MLKQGKKVLVIGIGPIISEALKASSELERQGINLAVASMGDFKPIDEEFLNKCIDDGYRNWISLEEHHQIGGLGTTLLEWINSKNIRDITLTRMGIGDHFIHKLGGQNYVRENERLTAEGIIKIARKL